MYLFFSNLNNFGFTLDNGLKNYIRNFAFCANEHKYQIYVKPFFKVKLLICFLLKDK